MSQKLLISPSIMCCGLGEVTEYIKAFEKKNVASIHFDVMDGHYVENIMLGTGYYQDLKKLTKLPIDLHLMCQDPERFFKYFNPSQGDWVSFHPETCNHPHRLLQEIKAAGCKAGIALNPGSQVNMIEEYADLLDFVLVMAVNPGFAGQKMVDSHLNKLVRIKKILNRYDKKIDIIVDGNTTITNARKMIQAGANGLVVGTSSLLKGVQEFIDNYDAYSEDVTSQ